MHDFRGDGVDNHRLSRSVDRSLVAVMMLRRRNRVLGRFLDLVRVFVDAERGRTRTVDLKLSFLVLLVGRIIAG